MKKLFHVYCLCVVVTGAIPAVATRVPQKARNSLSGLVQREYCHNGLRVKLLLSGKFSCDATVRHDFFIEFS